jgi:hypothetical protein
MSKQRKRSAVRIYEAPRVHPIPLHNQQLDDTPAVKGQLRYTTQIWRRKRNQR